METLNTKSKQQSSPIKDHKVRISWEKKFCYRIFLLAYAVLFDASFQYLNMERGTKIF